MGWSIEGADFINRLIQRKPTNRLGLNGPNEVKSHPWMRTFPWEDLKSSKLKAPFVPPVSYYESYLMCRTKITLTRIIQTVTGRTKMWRGCRRV